MTRDFPYPFPERFRSRLMLHYRTRISGTEVRKKLPFRVLLLGNLTGADAHAEPKNTQGQPVDPKAVLTAQPLDARPVHSYRFGKTGARVDDFMGQLLPYARLPKELVTVLPGSLKAPQLKGPAPSGDQGLVKLSGNARFVSTTTENGLCEVQGTVKLAADVEVDVTHLPMTVEVDLRGGGLVRGALTGQLSDEPIGVVAGVVRPGKGTLTLDRGADGSIVATLTAPPLSASDRRARIAKDADAVALDAAEHEAAATRLTTKVNALAAPTVPDTVPDTLKAILQKASDNIAAFLTDAKAAVAAYTTAAANTKTASASVDTRRDAVPAAGAADFGDKADKAEGGVRQARVVLDAAEKAGGAAGDAAGTAGSVVEEVNAAIASATTKLGTLGTVADASDQINLLAEVSNEVAAATARIPSAGTSIAKNKTDAETARDSVDMSKFEADADASKAAAGGDVPALAERVLPFDSLSSFTPDEVVANVPELSRLRVVRDLLLSLQADLRNSPELRDVLLKALKTQKAELEALQKDLAADYADLVIKRHPTP